MGAWGFPFTGADLCHFVKQYLDKKGETTAFKDNLPTRRFVTSFLKRHKEFSLRKTNPLKRSRARVSREEVQGFFANFAKVVEGVPPENIFNFDESPMRDDPKISKCIFKRGTKYCEMVLNTSKQIISIMFCGSASGDMWPPMIVYKAKNLYTSWCEKGPKNAIYACSPSGWFDGCLYEQWFFTMALPRLKRLPGKKVLICDNLSSHLSVSVINSCREHNIEFVCLPPNSTDKLQPLDVGVFAPLKAAWRSVLTDYKNKNPKQVRYR
jgi:hypothetical protein